VDELSGAGRIRASDAERERLARFLAAAFAEGRLDVAEFDIRVAAAYAAVYRDELIPLISDLPTPEGPLFDLRSPASKRLPTPAGGPATGLVRSRRRPYGWPAVLIMFGGALCLARWDMMTPFALLLLLLGLAIALSWITDDASGRGHRPGS
jgi:hypothetical protein